MNPRYLLHIAITVDNLEKAITTYVLLGFKASPPIRLDDFNVIMVEMHGENINLELAQPIDETENVIPRGVHHLAFNSADLLSDLKNFNIGNSAFRGSNSIPLKIFLPPDPNQGGLSIELIEEVQDGK